jgi:glucosamine-6-phosphate deaminase
MACKHIISVVPYAVKAEAIYNTLNTELSVDVPATLMKKHADCTVYCDADSASMLTKELIEKFA